MSDTREVFDVVVVGGGPGGIAAAVTAAEAGKTVALVDDCPLAGGQIWRNRGGTTLPRAALRWFARLSTCVRITRLQQSRITASLAPGALLADAPGGSRVLKFRSLVLATGARELFIPFPGWTLPGVFGAGAMQALIKAGMPVEGKRVVVAGTGPLLLAVADLLRAKGAMVPVIIEQAPAARIHRFGLSLARVPGKLAQAALLRGRLWRTSYATNSYPLRVDPAGSGLRIIYRRRGAERALECDYVACGFNLVPNTELASSLGCKLSAEGFVTVDESCQASVPGIFAVGEITGIGGVEKAVIEGQIAGQRIAGNDIRHLAPARASALAFARRLDAAFALRKELFELASPETIICRCEDVTLSSVAGCRNARDAKLQTRCGMGPCQGRICGPSLARIFGNEPASPRPPLMVASVGSLAIDPGVLSRTEMSPAAIFKEVGQPHGAN